jgi:predicted nucleic acid-binding protein
VIVVDTSVWIDANRRPDGNSATTLKALLDADEVALAWPVRVELVAGVVRRNRSAFLRGLSSLPVLRPSDDTFRFIDRWVPAAADKGLRFGLADWVIAALASEAGALVWSLDDDFRALERLKVVRLY